mmetsp:Transcript_6346/g.13979  ORF Transcript_6346/g.13979 Transcript_6346/m.13979 type:complete len:530 (-) Transcript_6346:2192-3781(-)|eukprot:CAMPEP_0183743960 /NCGR_PEP_ID=MMETSP0737-20130205/65483_1 /TAXON_ID=385413 /ORGANISM="Thalassiosira miniscula, Strain CCMP1093" /LENGTH=529 /DNA_ID=CAMNT_0025979593 /DNA_START=81 /DNA_END=1670 /DNA_ORIENTATION=-
MTRYNTSTHLVAAGLILFANQNNDQATSANAAALIDPIHQQTFADKLTSKLYNNANECSSALGVSMAFSLLYPACTGSALTELQAALGYPTNHLQQLAWDDTTQRMLSEYTGQCDGGEWEGVCDSQMPMLQIANAVWFHDKRGALNTNYQQVIGDYAHQINFEDVTSASTVNGWVHNSTNGLIDSIVEEGEPLFPPWEVVAINSIYLKASWKHPFKESKTNLDSFYSSPLRDDANIVSEAHFMNGVFNEVSYSHEALLGHQVVQLLFASSQMSMIFVLPLTTATGVGTTTAAAVQSTELVSILDRLEPTRVALSIPKFKFESTYNDNLKRALIQSGIVAPFQGGSFCGLFQNDVGCASLFVDEVIQKTVIDVNELGVEAAAATTIMLGRSAEFNLPDPIVMMCNHPFQFFIYDEMEGLVLFEGRVGMPEIPEGEPAEPLLDGKHSDEDFWTKAFYVTPVDPPTPTVDGTNDMPKSDVTDDALKPTTMDDGESPSSSSSSQSRRIFISAKKCFTLAIGALLGYALGFLLQ